MIERMRGLNTGILSNIKKKSTGIFIQESPDQPTKDRSQSLEGAAVLPPGADGGSHVYIHGYGVLLLLLLILTRIERNRLGSSIFTIAHYIIPHPRRDEQNTRSPI